MSLIWDINSDEIGDADVERVHSAVHAIALPTVCGLYQVVGMVLSIVQAWQRGFDRASMLVATLAVAHIIYSVRNVGAVSKVAAKADTADEARKSITLKSASIRFDGSFVRSTHAFIRKAMMFHYTGFITCTAILILQKKNCHEFELYS